MGAPKGNGLGATNDQPAKELTANTADFTGFLGTDNLRHLRVIKALLTNPRPREEIDQIAGCSNGPELIADLRRRGLEIPCTRQTKVDRDGLNINPGAYFVTQQDRQKITQWKILRGLQ